MLAAIVLLLAVLGLGHLAWRLRWLPESTPEVLHRFVLMICLPALVIQQVNGLSYDHRLLGLVAIAWIWAGLAVALVRLLTRPLKLTPEVRGCLLITLPLGNTAFLGYPMVSALLGPDALPPAVVYDQLGSFMILSTLGVALSAHYRDGQRPGVLTLARRILTFPAFIGLLIALLPFTWPAPAWAVVERLADCLVPLVLFAIGMQLRLRLPPGQGRGLIVGLVLKQGVGAAVALGLAWVFGLADALLQVAVLQAAMPVMVTAAALASEARQAPELASALAGIGVLVALLWLPLLAHVLR